MLFHFWFGVEISVFHVQPGTDLHSTSLQQGGQQKHVVAAVICKLYFIVFSLATNQPDHTHLFS